MNTNVDLRQGMAPVSSGPATEAATLPTPRKGFLEMLPQYVVAGSGIIYAAGFLVVLAFLDRFGIRDAGAELWKAKYIHVGILCLAFPFIVNGTILSLIHLIFHGKFNRSIMWQRLLPVGLLVINLEIACFVLIMLTDRQPGGQAIAGLAPLQWILAVTLIGIPALLGIERLIERVLDKTPQSDADISTPSHTWIVNSRWVLMVIVAGLDVWYIVSFTGTVKAASPWLGLTYVVFSLVLGVMLSTVAIYGRRQPHEGRKRAITVLAVSIILPFCYLVVLAFSYGVYQNIPATRGGGNFSASPKVVITFKDAQKPSSFDLKYFATNSVQVTIPLILIEETGWAFFLADPDEGGGPSEWKYIGGRKPQILVVNKSEVARLQSESRNP
jgi:hypothetical protein